MYFCPAAFRVSRLLFAQHKRFYYRSPTHSCENIKQRALHRSLSSNAICQLQIPTKGKSCQAASSLLNFPITLSSSAGPQWVSSPHPAAPCTATPGALNTLLACNITLMSRSISLKLRLMESEGGRRTTSRTNAKHMWLQRTLQLRLCACASLLIILAHEIGALVQL